jgi:hypothetical protein
MIVGQFSPTMQERPRGQEGELRVVRSRRRPLTEIHGDSDKEVVLCCPRGVTERIADRVPYQGSAGPVNRCRALLAY